MQLRQSAATGGSRTKAAAGHTSTTKPIPSMMLPLATPNRSSMISTIGGKIAPPSAMPVIAIVSGFAGPAGNQRATSADTGTPEASAPKNPEAAKHIHSCQEDCESPIPASESPSPADPVRNIDRVETVVSSRAASRPPRPPVSEENVGPVEAAVRENPRCDTNASI